MPVFNIIIAIPYDQLAARVKVINTFSDYCFLFIGLQVMQHICNDDGIIFFKIKIQHIGKYKIHCGCFTKTMIGRCYFFFVVINTRNFPFSRSKGHHI